VIVQMIGCDNPSCKIVAHAEEGGTPNKPNPPYGWLWLEAWGVMGCGPYFNKKDPHLMTCSVACLGPAVQHLLQETERLERER
jgi:hypothetical protein